jgi:hypothetical protein
MYGRVFPRVLFGLLVIAGVIGIGVYAYQLGVAQGIAQGAPAGAAVGPYWYPHPFFAPFWGFGCLIPLFLLFLVFGGMRAMFWRGHMGHGHWREKWSEGGVPPMFEEWHKSAHEPKTDASGEPKPEGKAAKV